MLSYGQAIVLGLAQGITELFPISSLGHTVILPALFGWHGLVAAESAPESFYLAFIVLLHVGTATGLLIYFREDWLRIIPAFFRTLGKRRIDTPDERMAWLLVIASIPAGITGLALEHTLRTRFLKPLPASIFLLVNGVILLIGEGVRRRTAVASGARPDATGAHRINVSSGVARRELNFVEALVIGFAQTFALLAGISRSGVTMVAGIVRGLDHEAAARFTFLLATPIIFAAGLLKLPDLFGPLGNGVRMQTLVGGICAAVTAYLSTRFLMRYFETKTLWPFGVYCIVAGALCILRFA
ncbi:MAG TPA: undecaprenyl-diphosphate phosphatase [Actinomycetota bacterium]|nr:undecaprenyl-diphosphate phosphatase [Actinomycetota bacterium]